MNNDPITDLCTLLARLPGVGDRTAHRYAHHLLGEHPTLSQELGRALSELHDRTVRCTVCGNYASTKGGAPATCSICTSHKRENTVCVVAHVPDLEAIERSGSYQGQYHVLHALLAPLDGMHSDALHSDRLVQRVIDQRVPEVILALPASVEGEATALYLQGVLEGRVDSPRVTRIASGIQYGGNIDLADPITIGRAFAGRAAMRGR